MYLYSSRLSTRGKIQPTAYQNTFLIFPPKKQDLAFTCGCLQISPIETIGMNCQILFSGNDKKIITNLSFAELTKRAVKVNAKVSIASLRLLIYVLALQ